MLPLHLPLNYHGNKCIYLPNQKNRNNKKERVIVNFGVYASEQKLPLTAGGAATCNLKLNVVCNVLCFNVFPELLSIFIVIHPFHFFLAQLEFSS